MSSRSKMIIIGGLIGAALGATAAWAYSQARDQQRLEGGQKSGHLRRQAGMPDYVKIGVSTMSLIRQIVDLFKKV